jgi:hypothetical protein
MAGIEVGRVSSLLAALVFLVCLARPADARITRIQITSVQSPSFEGMSFGATGQYEKLVGRVDGEIDPKDPLNAIITDIKLAPVNARGMVEYSSNVMIIRPVDPGKGNHKLLFEINNRGHILALASLNDAAQNSNNPAKAADAGNGFLMRQGYTLARGRLGCDLRHHPGGRRRALRARRAGRQEPRRLGDHRTQPRGIRDRQ